jgi:hypothetical protein
LYLSFAGALRGHTAGIDIIRILQTQVPIFMSGRIHETLGAAGWNQGG